MLTQLITVLQMLKTRLIPCILTKGELVIQSFGFKKYLPVGNVKIAIEFFENWDVDEIVLIDIDATKENREPNFKLIEWAAKGCFVPLTVGGGVSSIDHVKKLLRAGADKVCVNSSINKNLDFITEISNTFGSQCLTVSVDVIRDDEEFKVYDYLLGKVFDKPLIEFVTSIEQAGAGEILLNSVDRDGSRKGYDTELLSYVSDSLTIPVIALGGVGRFDQLADGVKKGNCQALAAANIFQHMEHSTIAAKAQMKASGLDVRLSSSVKYEDFDLDALGRPY